MLILKLKDEEIKRYILEKSIITIGRDPDNDIFIENQSVSRLHAQITKSPQGEFRIEDLKSSNGTYVNTHRIEHPFPLSDGDVVKIGKYEVVFYNENTQATRKPNPASIQEKTIVLAKEQRDDRFLAASSEGSGDVKPPKLVLQSGKAKRRVINLTKNETTIGRADDNDLQIGGLFAPKYLAKVIRDLRGNYFIIDLEGKERITVNGDLVKEKRRLEEKDVISFKGIAEFVFR